MLASSIPTKFPFPFANSAGASFIRPVPIASQIGINPGAASDTDGFVPLNFLVPSAGGIPPDGRDVNGILNQMSAWDMWQSVGGPVYYDAAQSSAIGGYPQGALLNAVGFTAGYWWSQVDNNTSDPDTGGANWFFIQLGSSATYVAIVPQTTFFVNNSTGSDTTGNGLTTGTAWRSIAHAISVLLTYNLNGNNVTIQLGLTGVSYAGPTSPISAPNNGALIIRGDPAAQGSYGISGTAPANGGVIAVIGSGTVSLTGLTIANTNAQGSCLTAQNGAIVPCTDVTFVTFTGAQSVITVSVQGSVQLGAGCILEGSAISMINIDNGGSIVQAGNLTVSGSPAYTTVISCLALGLYTMSAAGWTWSGTCTGQRYNVNLGGVIYTLGGGASFFPGSSAGTTNGGSGQYA